MLRGYWAVALLILPSVVTVARAEEPLRWRLKEKDQLRVEWRSLKNASGTRGGVAFMDQEEVTVLYTLAVRRVEPGKRIILEQKIESIKDEVRGGRADLLPGMIEGVTLTVTLDNHLNVVGMEGSEPIVKRILGDKPGPKAAVLKAAVESQCKLWLQDVLIPLPDPGHAGSWDQQTETYLPPFGRLARKKTYTRAGTATIDGKAVSKITVQGVGTLKPSGMDETSLPVRNTKLDLQKSDYEGTLYFDAAAGRLLRAETRHRSRMTTSFEVQGRRFEACGLQDEVTTARIMDRPPAALAEAARPNPPLTKHFTNSLGMKLVLVPPGKFRMGAPPAEDRWGVEAPHQVEITRPYYLGAHEVTIGQFRRFAEATGYRADSEKNGRGAMGYNKVTGRTELSTAYSWRNPGWDHTDEHPAVNLSHNDARAFCDWLTRQEGRTYRLPTEAEWEYACRAGTTTPYASGDDPETLATIGNVTDASAAKVFPNWRTIRADDGYTFTAPVGRFKPNAFGLYDMHGNALEWCADWYWRYDPDARQDPRGAPSGTTRVQRGGSWADFPDQCRSASRTGFEPERYCISSGFRVAVPADGAAPKSAPK